MVPWCHSVVLFEDEFGSIPSILPHMRLLMSYFTVLRYYLMQIVVLSWEVRGRKDGGPFGVLHRVTTHVRTESYSMWFCPDNVELLTDSTCQGCQISAVFCTPVCDLIYQLIIRYVPASSMRIHNQYWSRTPMVTFETPISTLALQLAIDLGNKKRSTASWGDTGSAWLPECHLRSCQSFCQDS